MAFDHLFLFCFRYVSDVGLNGYKYICQHKILQSAYMDPLLSRVYPPTFLEWQAIQRKANIGLEVKFADGKRLLCLLIISSVSQETKMCLVLNV